MIEVNAALFILLIESLAVVSIVLVLILVLAMRKRRRKQAAIAQLVSQIKKQSELRTQETGSFLQEIYQLEDKELAKAVKTIDKSEKQLFQKLVDSYLHLDPELIVTIDAAVAGMVDAYKELKPKAPEIDNSADDEREALLKQVQQLEESNEKLKEELSITKSTMSNMISEFGNMFGGGADHELASYEVVEKVEEKTTEQTS